MDIKKANIKFNGTLISLGTVKKIIQHHPAHPTWNYLDIHLYHRDILNWMGAGYNYYIAFNGDIYELRGLNRGAHARGRNTDTIGIAYQGHFGRQKMTDAQLKSGVKLNVYLLKKYNLTEKDILGHRDVGATACPDRNFRESELVREVGRKLKGKAEPVDIKQPPKNQVDNTHVVQSGDTLYKISKEYDVSVDELQKLNPDVDPNAMSIGQEIIVIQEDIINKIKEYKIKSGDTFWGIANTLDVSVEDLYEMNPDVDPTNLSIGQTIYVADGLEEIENEQQADIDKTPLWTGIISSDALNVRDQAGMSGSIVRVVLNGETVEVFEDRGNWLKISDNLNEFVHRSHVNKSSNPVNNSGSNLPTRTLRRGDRGVSVKKLQKALNSVYFKVGAEDGVFGAKTEDGLKRFQSMYAPPIDGVYGRKTRSALDNKLNK